MCGGSIIVAAAPTETGARFWVARRKILGRMGLVPTTGPLRPRPSSRTSNGPPISARPGASSRRNRIDVAPRALLHDDGMHRPKRSYRSVRSSLPRARRGDVPHDTARGGSGAESGIGAQRRHNDDGKAMEFLLTTGTVPDTVSE